MMKNNTEFNKYWQERTSSEEFKSDLKKLVNGISDEILELTIEKVVDELNECIKQTNLEQDGTVIGQLAKSFILSYGQPSLSEIESKNLSVSQLLEKPTLKAWRDLLDRPVVLPEETLDSILEQPAIKELLINIIHDAIIAFNKKYNPLYGAMAIFGVDKQIKEFLKPFMDKVTAICRKFLLDEKNSKLFQDFTTKLFDIMTLEKPKNYIKIPDKESRTKLAKALELTGKDEVFHKELKDFALRLLKLIRDKNGKKTIREFLKENNINNPIRDLTDWEVHAISKHMGMNAYSTFMFNEFSMFKK